MSVKTPLSIVSFSHLDLFWAGTREECLSRGMRVIRTALDLLGKYPEYRFLVESTSFAEALLNCFPEDKKRMQSFIDEGRLEIIPMRSIIYSHLPSGETTVRNLLYGREFCRDEFEYEPRIMSLSDIPGVTAQLPQIAAQAGMSEIVLSRGFRTHTDHVFWTGPDGTAIRAYCPSHYTTLCDSLSHEDYSKMVAGDAAIEEYLSMVDYPQVLHWGMDLYILNETILKNIIRRNREGFRPYVFSTFREFFDATRNVPLKELSGELPSSWPHIETSWPDLWPLDVPTENAMLNAEFFGTLNLLSGYRNDYPGDAMKQAWLRLLDSMDHNQNGIGSQIADQDKLNLKLSAQMTANHCMEHFLQRIAARTSAPSKNAAPIIVFNPLAWRRSGLVTARAACYGRTFATCFDGFETSSQYYLNSEPYPFRLIDSDGNEIPFKVEEHLSMLSDTFTLTFNANDVPALGSKVYYLIPEKPAKNFESPFAIIDDRENDLNDDRRYIAPDSVENQFFRLEIHRLTGEMKLIDKRTERTLFDKISIRALEEKRGEYIYWMDLSGRVFPSVIDKVEVTENNPVYCRIRIDGSVCGVRFEQHITLPAEEPVLEIKNIIYWEKVRYVRIEQTFPFATAEPLKIIYGTPFGCNKYPDTMYQTAENPDPEFEQHPTYRIRLVRDWISTADSAGGAVIGSDHRMWTIEDNSLNSCMVRGIGWTSGGSIIQDDGSRKGVERPPAGKYTFHYRIAPFAMGTIPNGRAGFELNRPMICAATATGETSDRPGLVLPPMPDLTDTSLVLSCTKPSFDGSGVIFRFYEGNGENAELQLPDYPGYCWFSTDLTESNLSELTTRTVSFGKFEIRTFLLRPKVSTK